MVPYNPQFLEVARERLPAALAQAFDVEEVLHGVVPRPSNDPRHVFDIDCPQHWRIIITRDGVKYPDDYRQLLHVSISIRDRSSTHYGAPLEKVLDAARAIVCEMFGRPMEPIATRLSPIGTIHFFFHDVKAPAHAQ